MNNWELASRICDGDIQGLESRSIYDGGNRFYAILGSMVVDLDSTEISLVGIILHSVWRCGKQTDRINRLKTALNAVEMLIRKVGEVTVESGVSGDNVNHPNHYNRGTIECIDALPSILDGLDATGGFYIGNFIKYIWRWKGKNGLEDLNKAKWYLSKYIERYGGVM